MTCGESNGHVTDDVTCDVLRCCLARYFYTKNASEHTDAT